MGFSKDEIPNHLPQHHLDRPIKKPLHAAFLLVFTIVASLCECSQDCLPMSHVDIDDCIRPATACQPFIAAGRRGPIQRTPVIPIPDLGMNLPIRRYQIWPLNGLTPLHQPVGVQAKAARRPSWLIRFQPWPSAWLHPSIWLAIAGHGYLLPICFC